MMIQGSLESDKQNGEGLVASPVYPEGGQAPVHADPVSAVPIILPSSNANQVAVEGYAPVEPGRKISYSGLERSAWKDANKSKLCLLLCDWFAAALYFVVMGMSVQIENNATISSVSIYTQGIQDWTQPSWSEFTWSATTECPSGYEAISNIWLGTVEGNKTESGIEKTYEGKTGDIAPQPAVKQTQMWQDQSSIICGKRDSQSYVDATRVELDTKTVQFTCPSGLVACSTNILLAGSTYCVETADKCPVTQVVVFPEDLISEIVSDDRWTKIQTVSGSPQMTLAYTKVASDESNAPLQQVAWQLGTPCAFADQQNVVPSSKPQPQYYPLETVTNLKTCQDLYTTTEGEMTSIAADQRFFSMLQLQSLEAPSVSYPYPNEYEIQSLSSVLETLSELPDFEQYLPNADADKKKLSYDLLGRTTLEFSASCGKSVSSAVDSLRELQKYPLSIVDYNLVVLYSTISMLCVVVIYMAINTYCLCSKYRERLCYKANAIVYSSIFLAIGISMIILVSLNFGTVHEKYAALADWTDYSSCVDPYMGLSDFQQEQINHVVSGAIVQLITTIVILVIHISTFSAHLYLLCCYKKVVRN